MARWLSVWGESWAKFEMELQELVDAGDQVVFLFRLYATGRGSGVPVERDDAMVYSLQEGKVVRIDYYNDQAQALKVSGVGEGSSSSTPRPPSP